MAKKRYVKGKDRMFCGVLSGLAAYMDWDVTWTRLGFAALALLTGVGPFLVLYIVACFIVPER